MHFCIVGPPYFSVFRAVTEGSTGKLLIRQLAPLIKVIPLAELFLNALPAFLHVYVKGRQRGITFQRWCVSKPSAVQMEYIFTNDRDV